MLRSLAFSACMAGALACSRRGSPPPPSQAPVVVLAPASAAPAPAASAAAPTPEAARAAAIRARYAKFEYRVPMRDGVRLFTSVYVPNDASPTKRYPFLIVRTPYSAAPYAADRYSDHLGPTEAFEKEGFIFVFQDVRGQHMSEGTFVDVRPIRRGARGPREADESTDAYDTVAWLLANVPHNNGKAGQWGISYPGFYASAAAIDSHPALVAVSPQAPIADWWIGDDFHRNGAFNLYLAFGFFSRFGVPRPAPTDNEDFWPPFDFGTPDAYQFFLDKGPLSEIDAQDLGAEIQTWKDAVAHPDYDTFWQERNILPRLEAVRASTLVIGGWYDAEDLYGSLETYRAIEAKNPRARNTLVMGPWRHGGWVRTPGDKLGDAEFGYPTSEGFQPLLLAYFVHHLKGGPDPRLPEAYVFETGANRWRSFAAWPPAEAKDTVMYLRADGALAPEPPSDTGAFDEFPSDPAKPVPFTANPTMHWRKVSEYMAEDQRFASRRPDVLVYRSAPLTEDVTIAGPIDVELHVSTTGTDADWVVKLVDEFPGMMPGMTARDADEGDVPNRGARQELVRGEPFRGRYRESLSAPKAFTPGEIAKVAFRLDDVFHTFKRGHRIMVHVQSSWFPLIDRNPQTFVPNIYKATRADFIKATHRVHRAAGAASVIKTKRLPAPDQAAPAAK